MIRCLLLGCVLTLALPAKASDVTHSELAVDAPGLSAQAMRVRVYLPPGYAYGEQRYPVLYVNDGQDMEAVALVATLNNLYADDKILPIIVVAVDVPPDRMAGYGFFDRLRQRAIVAPTKYGDVGADAWRYAEWLTSVLVPRIDASYRTQSDAKGRALLGWSLGAASAFGIGWQYPELFGQVGAFSPSFWLSTGTGSAADAQASRIAHRDVLPMRHEQAPRVFVAVGTEEETVDRDGDGIVDVIDDTGDLVAGWLDPDGRWHPGICKAFPVRNTAGVQHCESATMLILEGGKHQQASWARLLPPFLQWAYGRPTAAD